MAFSLTLALLGLSSHAPEPLRSEYYWITAIADAIFVLLAFLLTYIGCLGGGYADYFRTMAVKPAGKQVNSKLLLTQLLPCAIVTATVGGIVIMILPALVIITAGGIYVERMDRFENI